MFVHGLKGPVSKSHLIDQAARVRRKVLSSPSLPNKSNISTNVTTLTTSTSKTNDEFYQEYSSAKTLFYPTSYKKRNGRRGFSNWLLKDCIMIGQYPCQTPEDDGPSLSCAKEHIDSLVIQSNIRLFCCLQSEIPAQDDFFTWTNIKGKKYFDTAYERRQFPNYFGHYAPLVEKSFATMKNDKNNNIENDAAPTFLHSPIIDLSTPSSSSQLYETLSLLLDTLESRPECAIYIHCWGGRGRAGLVGACLLSLLFPQLSSSEILEWVQRGYDTRLGAEEMPSGLKQSPQTSSQREFVRKFVEEIRLDTY